MAKKSTRTTTSSPSNYHIVTLTAFWGIIISGIASLVTFIIQCLVKWNIISGAGSTVSRVIGIMNLIANLALFISVFLAAYAHSKRVAMFWNTLFWVFAIIALLSILGFNIFYMF